MAEQSMAALQSALDRIGDDGSGRGSSVGEHGAECVDQAIESVDGRRRVPDYLCDFRSSRHSRVGRTVRSGGKHAIEDGQIAFEYACGARVCDYGGVEVGEDALACGGQCRGRCA